MSNVHLTSLSHNLSLKVVFLFQSFLAITVFLRFLKNAPMKTGKIHENKTAGIDES